MRGTLIGDIVGSTLRNIPQESTNFQLLQPTSTFSDTSIMTMATADAIMNDRSYDSCIKEWVLRFPIGGYSEALKNWAYSNKEYYGFDNTRDGAVQRISPIGFAANSIEEALWESQKAASITHDSINEIKAAQAVAGVIFLAKEGKSKHQIKDFLFRMYDYEFTGSLDQELAYNLQEHFDSSAPIAFLAFMDANSYEDTIRKAIWLGGNTGVVASIAGAIAQAFYKHIPKSLIRKTKKRLPNDMELLLQKFEYHTATREKNVIGTETLLHFH